MGLNMLDVGGRGVFFLHGNVGSRRQHPSSYTTTSLATRELPRRRTARYTLAWDPVNNGPAFRIRMPISPGPPNKETRSRNRSSNARVSQADLLHHDPANLISATYRRAGGPGKRGPALTQAFSICVRGLVLLVVGVAPVLIFENMLRSKRAFQQLSLFR